MQGEEGVVGTMANWSKIQKDPVTQLSQWLLVGSRFTIVRYSNFPEVGNLHFCAKFLNCKVLAINSHF